MNSNEEPVDVAVAVEGRPEGDHVPAKAEDAAPQPMQLIGGEVRILIDARTGALQVSAPPNQLVALAIIEAAKAFITMQMQDGMRRSVAATAPPAIVKAGADALSRLRRPS